jgi:BolA protein
MTVAETIRRKLTAAFACQHLDVVDQSQQHVGHAGARPGGESHFAIAVVAREFTGRSPLERHRLIHAVLAEELAGPVHALSIHAVSPEEAARQPARS